MAGQRSLKPSIEGSSPSSPATSCPLCEREVSKGYLERHHLRTRRTDKDDTEFICRDCHKTIHGLFSNTLLRDPRSNLDSLEGLLANEQFRSALAFIRKTPPGSYMRMRESRQRRKRR